MTAYRHVQYAPLCLLLYGLVAVELVLTAVLWHERPLRFILPSVAFVIAILAASFHHLTVEDVGERLAIRFGPIPLFGRSVRYDDIVQVEVGRTTFWEGWGIHMSPRGGWVWNLWGRDCVVVRTSHGVLRIGTDDAGNLAAFLNSRLRRPNDGA